MRNFQKKFEDVMEAVTFAEAGEFDTARELAGHNGKVLFATKKGQADEKALKHAISICKRIGAGLEVLYISSKKGLAPAFDKIAKMLKEEGVECTLSERVGCLRNQIIDHTNENKDIRFVVIESSEHLDSNCRRISNQMSDAWENLTCPLVVVSELVKA